MCMRGAYTFFLSTFVIFGDPRRKPSHSVLVDCETLFGLDHPTKCRIQL